MSYRNTISKVSGLSACLSVFLFTLLILLLINFFQIRNAPAPPDTTEKGGNYIMSQRQLQGGIFDAAVCSKCLKGQLVVCEEGMEGWAVQLALVCMACGERSTFWSSRPLSSGHGKEINR